MNGLHLQIILTVAVVLASAGLLLCSAFTIGYHITPTHLKITWLGLPVRRIRLDDIKRIGTRPVIWAERWPNTLRNNGRLLVIRRRSGWLRSLVITPEYPFEFRNELEQARKAAAENSSIFSTHPPGDGTARRAA
jgi:hypothetical protein